MFEQTSIDLGFVKVGNPYTVKYKYNGVKSIEEVKGSCDCIDFQVDTKNNRLLVIWKPKPVPQHLKDAGTNTYTTQKTITVRLTDNEDKKHELVLLFNAKVIE